MSSVEKAVVAKILMRAAKGKAKYGTTMDREDLTFSEWLTHLQEEMMDATVYAEKILDILESDKWEKFLEWDEAELRCDSCGAYKDVHECWHCDCKRCVNCDMDEMRSEEDGHTYCHDCTLKDAEDHDLWKGEPDE